MRRSLVLPILLAVLVAPLASAGVQSSQTLLTDEPPECWSRHGTVNEWDEETQVITTGQIDSDGCSHARTLAAADAHVDGEEVAAIEAREESERDDTWHDLWRDDGETSRSYGSREVNESSIILGARAGGANADASRSCAERNEWEVENRYTEAGTESAAFWRTENGCRIDAGGSAAGEGADISLLDGCFYREDFQARDSIGSSEGRFDAKSRCGQWLDGPATVGRGARCDDRMTWDTEGWEMHSTCRRGTLVEVHGVLLLFHGSQSQAHMACGEAGCEDSSTEHDGVEVRVLTFGVLA